MRYAFRRLLRTASSEQWLIYQPGVHDEMGSFDIHIKPNDEVYATLFLTVELEEAELDPLIQDFDDDVVDMANLDKGNFFVTVYQGQQIGSFRILAEEEEEEEEEEAEEAEEEAE